uniref:spore cortex biosynthesis protein YabQ n=1 Tax=Acetatifactor sp. TaxID=1872090 RepID=UPI0040570B42
MENENIFLFYALLMGIFITFVYDILRIFRRVIPHGNLLISLEDIGFWIYCATKVFLLMYHESNGTLRWFAILGALVGMFLYKKLVSGFFVKYVSMALRKVLDILVKIVRVVLKPAATAFQKAKKVRKTAKARSARKKEQAKWFLKKKLTFLRKMLK